jgi:hypothetical protein
MGAHLTDDVLMDVCEGTAGPEARAHVEACAECRGRVAEASEGLVFARQVDAPEPSPLYWPALRRNVATAIDASPRRARLWWAPPALAAAAARVVIAVLPLRTQTPVAPQSPVAVLPAWSALPPAEDDPGLPVLAGVAPQAADALVGVSCQDVSGCLATLSDEEDAQLADALAQEWGGRAL